MRFNDIPRAAMAALAGAALCALSAPAFAETTPGDAETAAPADSGGGDTQSPGDASHELVPFRNGGRLLLTGGVSTIEGAGGGGLVPWALIGGYGTRDEFGIQSYVTGVKSEDFALVAFGASANIKNRLEISLGRQNFHLRDVGKALGLGNDFIISQTIIGAKVRLIGDAVLDQNTLVPQISVGVQHKINDDKTVVGGALGLRRSSTDFYIAATKLFLDKNLLVNTTVRLTKANQYGILGFGGLGGKDQAYKPTFEASAAYLLTRKLAFGAEVRTKSNRLQGALGGDSFREDAAYDIFGAYALGRNLSLTAAYVDLGHIALKNQHAAYLSLQVGF
ncbi:MULTISPECIES: DUF3034 family protein [unclassified Novosphingobium]|uniref:DUF3034 family protein n=1 Tax=unclassified Novosphingobium TaxID=2644732 RepID=UPI000D301814|nr:MULTISPECIES: DUF3034 family protein [unclassified Novosphingobium]PTR10980.1 Protein of unknown function (DUF3034) [Novosphingobium sp. GV055]PUB03530.1 Protein of unknown function (DUF3034) [Novosphingobium sp. GV061]PUB19985.1 Protein of unknown function (DUF3034) [Novosphingobium sp. GV079]PUB41746.1 Protein of unknown function (DUF3034) [Novosphingobium sp. GV027]